MTYYRFTLPGADTFARFLDSRLPSMVIADGPSLTLIDGQPYRWDWTVSHEGEILGTYQRWAQKRDEKDFKRLYHGIVPGYVNLETLAYGETRSRHNLGDVRLVSLTWGNEMCLVDVDSYGWKHPTVIRTPWQRQDGHHSIPFP